MYSRGQRNGVRLANSCNVTRVARLKLEKIPSYKGACGMRMSFPILEMLRSEHRF